MAAKRIPHPSVEQRTAEGVEARTKASLSANAKWKPADDRPDPIGLLVVSGDEAAADPNVRVLAERSERVLVTSMFHGLAVGWADLVLPGTSYLERDGTYVNLEGRLQRLRRAAIPPAPDELAWISRGCFANPVVEGLH